MTIERLKQQIDFIIEVDKLKTVFRRSYITGGTRKENDAEHSWHISLMAILLMEHARDTHLDILKVIKMLLIHDLVEIYAGDIIVYDLEQRKQQEEKEKKAADTLFSMLPADQKEEFHSLWNEYEAHQTAEACFARSLDRLQPILLNYYSRGKTWKEADIRAGDVLKVNSIIDDGSSQLWEYAQELVRDAVEKEYLGE